MNKDVIIEGDKVILRSMTEDTSELYRQLRNREDNRHFFFTEEEIDEASQKKWFIKYLSDENQMMFAVFDKISGRFAGGIGIYDIVMGKSAEIGRIIIDRRLFSGRGFGSEAVFLLSEYVMKEKLAERVYAYIKTGNIASMKTFERCGFRLSEDTIKTQNLFYEKHFS